MTSKDLDKFYTKLDNSKSCFDKFVEIVGHDFFFVEPSAGNGSFLDVIPGINKIGFDIKPERSDIIELDFLKKSIKKYLPEGKKIAFIGNPPFGKRSELAIKFINKCLTCSKYVGFILPIQFRKYSAQSKIRKNAKLIFDTDLEHDLFLIDGKETKVSCCFQIWSTDKDFKKNLKVDIPVTSHSDFEIYQYNGTIGTEKYFDYDWDFVVVRQGFKDYKKIYYKKEDCDKKQQMIFFKAKNEVVRNRLLNLDFEKLSKKNTVIPGFGKADVVQEYNRLYNNESENDSYGKYFN